MSDLALNIFSKAVFSGSIILIIYLFYKECMINKIKAEKSETVLEELKNEDAVKSETDIDLVNAVNKDFSSGSTSSSNPKKPTS